jgi:hypothetical protein
VRGLATRATLLLAAALAAGCRADEPRRPPPPPRPDLQAPEARLDLQRLERAIRLYAEDRAGRLPSDLSALATESPPERPEPYVARVPLDPWGRPYSYAVLSPRLGTYDLRSYGADTLPGTDDDVVVKADPVPVR